METLLFAHAVEPGGGLAAGFLHPLTGIDHLLAILGIGIACRRLVGGAAFVPLAGFVLAMLIGAALALKGIAVPLVEPGIAFSTAFAGIAILLAKPLPAPVLTVAGIVFGIAHGAAHGDEIPAAASTFKFSLGFLVAAALASFLGWAAGALTNGGWRAMVTGALLIAAGLYFFVGAVS